MTKTNKRGKIEVSLIILFVLFFLIGVFSVLLVGEDNLNNFAKNLIEGKKQIPLSENQIIQDCANLSLKETSYCLRDNIETFYSYNITDDSLNLSFNQIKTRGGDCKDWAELYNRLADELNFSTTKPHVITGDSAHTFSIISDEGGYCVVDQLGVSCASLE